MSTTTKLREQIQRMDTSRPYAVSEITKEIMFDIAGILEESLKLQTAQIPLGLFLSQGFAITTEEKELIPEQTQTGVPWIAAEVFNDGPNDLYVSIYNKDGRGIKNKVAPLSGSNKDSLIINFKTRNIAKVILQAVTGNTNVRIYATA